MTRPSLGRWMLTCLGVTFVALVLDEYGLPGIGIGVALAYALGVDHGKS